MNTRRAQRLRAIGGGRKAGPQGQFLREQLETIPQGSVLPQTVLADRYGTRFHTDLTRAERYQRFMGRIDKLFLSQRFCQAPWGTRDDGAVLARLLNPEGAVVFVWVHSPAAIERIMREYHCERVHTLTPVPRRSTVILRNEEK